MRILRSGVAGVVVIVAVALVLLTGCELREGSPREYGAGTGTSLGSR